MSRVPKPNANFDDEFINAIPTRKEIDFIAQQYKKCEIIYVGNPKISEKFSNQKMNFY